MTKHLNTRSREKTQVENSIYLMKKRDHQMQRRAQAALEFLSTYGFAFLIILVMIGALSYFGVLSPNKLIPNRCSFPAEFNCFEFQITAVTGAGTNNASLSVVLINQLGNTVTFNDSMTIATSQFGNSYNTSGGAMTCTTSAGGVTGNASIIGGDRVTVSCLLNQAPSSGVLGFPAKGEKVKIGIDVYYHELGRQYWQPARGEILGTLV